MFSSSWALSVALVMVRLPWLMTLKSLPALTWAALSVVLPPEVRLRLPWASNRLLKYLSAKSPDQWDERLI